MTKAKTAAKDATTVEELGGVVHKHGNILNQHSMRLDFAEKTADKTLTLVEQHVILITEMKTNQSHFDKAMIKLDETVANGFKGIKDELSNLIGNDKFISGNANAIKNWLIPILGTAIAATVATLAIVKAVAP